jgi:hypothetical protein
VAGAFRTPEAHCTRIYTYGQRAPFNCATILYEPTLTCGFVAIHRGKHNNVPTAGPWKLSFREYVTIPHPERI